MTLNGFEKNKKILEGRKLFLVCGNSFDRLEISDFIKNLNPVRFGGFTPNPKHEEVLDGVEKFLGSGCDTILAVGGGSAMDVAKCIKYYSGTDAELIVIPTTSGTGSEATHSAVEYRDGEKTSVADESMVPDIAVLEPSVLKHVPEYTRKATMLDAMCHAIESWWSKKSTEESRAYSEKAISMILKNMDSYLANEDEGNAGMLEAANIAGKAINITATTAAHAMCYKITSLYGLQHGHSAAICLNEVWKYIDANPGITREEFAGILKKLEMSYPESSNYEYDLDVLTDSVNEQRLNNSPYPFSKKELYSMYEMILKAKKNEGDRIE